MTTSTITSRPPTRTNGESGLDSVDHPPHCAVQTSQPGASRRTSGTDWQYGTHIAPMSLASTLSVATSLCNLHSQATKSHSCAIYTAIWQQSELEPYNSHRSATGKGMAPRQHTEQAVCPAESFKAVSPDQAPRTADLCKLHSSSGEDTALCNFHNTAPDIALHHVTGRGTNPISNTIAVRGYVYLRAWWRLARAAWLGDMLATKLPNHVVTNVGLCNLHSRWQSRRRLFKSHHTETSGQCLCELHSITHPVAMYQHHGAGERTRQRKLRRRIQRQQGVQIAHQIGETTGREIHALLSFWSTDYCLCNLHRQVAY